MINFLPQSYRQRERHRQRRRRQRVLAALLMLVVVGWGLAQQDRTAELRRRAEAVEQQVQTVHNRMLVTNRMRERERSLRRQVELQRRLTPALGYRHLVAVLGRRMPREVALTDLRMSLSRPDPEQARGGSSQAGEDEAEGPNDGEVEPGTVQMKLIGRAPGNLAVANFLSALEEDPLFSDVSMRHSRPTRWRGREVQGFALDLEVGLARRFEPSGEGRGVHLSRQGANHAD